MRRIVLGGFVLIAGYLVLQHYTGFGRDLAAGSSAVVPVVKVLQGR